MALTFDLIKERYLSIIGDTHISNGDLANRIDEAQIIISKYFGKIVSHNYLATKDLEYDLPVDHLKTEEVRDSSKNRYRDYVINEEGKIIFSEDGQFTLYYTKVPLPINPNVKNAAIEVHDVFQHAIIRYCVYRHWEERSEGIPAEEAKAERILQRFYRQVEHGTMVLRKRTHDPEYLQIGY